MKARIYKPTKSNMQSGNAKQYWLLEFVQADNSKYIDPYLARTSSTDMMNEVNLSFSSAEEAIAFANKHNYFYEVIKPQTSRFIKKSYADNFK